MVYDTFKIMTKHASGNQPQFKRASSGAATSKQRIATLAAARPTSSGKQGMEPAMVLPSDTSQ